MAINSGGHKVNILTKVICGRFERNEAVTSNFFLPRSQMQLGKKLVISKITMNGGIHGGKVDFDLT